MHILDIITVVAYLFFIISLGIYFGRNQDREEFFVAGGSMGFLTVGLSVMATLFSSNSFVFYPSAALGDSLKIALSLIAFTMMTPIVIKVFIPVYARLRVETAYEYLEKRYDVYVRSVASGLFVLLRIGWMASATYAASVVVKQVSGIDETVVIVGLGVISIGYTMLGGLRAVMRTMLFNRCDRQNDQNMLAIDIPNFKRCQILKLHLHPHYLLNSLFAGKYIHLVFPGKSVTTSFLK